MSQNMLPWPRFVNPGLYISIRLSMLVELENGSCEFFLDLFKVKVKYITLPLFTFT